jgi:hypothetical protein
MDNSAIIIVLLAISMALLLPGLIWLSRLPRMDQQGDDFGVVDDPLLQWPPSQAERAQLRRITRLLVVMAVVLVLLSIAFYLAWRSA